MDYLNLDWRRLLPIAIGFGIGYFLITQLIKSKHSSPLSPTPSSTPSSITPTPGQYYLKGGRGFKYCSDDPTGLICNRDFPSGWDLFTFEYHPRMETYTIRGPRGYYCSSSNFGLVCNQRTASTDAEHFKVVPSATDPSLVKIYSYDGVLPCADHGNGLRCDHRDDQGMDVFKLIPASYVAQTPLSAKRPRNERILPITGPNV